MNKIMSLFSRVSSFIKSRFAVALCAVLTLPAFAEGESSTITTKIDTEISNWVDTAKTAIEGWVTKLSPLFLVALGVILLFAAWAVFKKVTNKAK